MSLVAKQFRARCQRVGEEVSRFPNHSSLAVTTRYLRRLEGQEGKRWEKETMALSSSGEAACKIDAGHTSIAEFPPVYGGLPVPAQVRIYTINRGEMDTFLKHFESETIPLHESVGWPIVATWVNREQNEFIWIRTHVDAQDLDEKTKALQKQREALGIQLGGNVAKMEVREVEPAFVAVPSDLLEHEE